MAQQETTPIHIKVISCAVFMLFLPAIGCIFDGVGTIIKQTLMWFKFGYWTPFEFWDGLSKWLSPERPSLGWVIPNKALQWVLSGPRWLWMIITGTALFCVDLILLLKITQAYERVLAWWDGRNASHADRA